MCRLRFAQAGTSTRHHGVFKLLCVRPDGPRIQCDGDLLDNSRLTSESGV